MPATSAAQDMAAPKWSLLKRLFGEWVDEERAEPEHAEDEAEWQKTQGRLTERDKESAGRVGSEHREEEPEDVFLEPGERKYPVREKIDGEWKYDRRLLLAAAREARMHGHESLAKRADEIREREFGGAQDEALIAFDRSTPGRSYDENGYMHIPLANISKSNICEYLGREIPDFENLGLDPNRRYKLLRHPDELKQAADTFNGLPLLWRHQPTHAEDHPHDIVIGSLGNDAEFKEPYLTNSLTVWPAHASKAIEDGQQKELSCGYSYDAQMVPGVHQGEKYDGVMRNLRGNHIALVSKGRAGADVAVDEALPPIWNFARFIHPAPHRASFNFTHFN